MLFGEHSVVYGYPCIVTAVDQRMRAMVEPNGVGELHVMAPQIGLTDYTKRIGDLGNDEMPRQVRFIERLVANFYREHNLDKGIRITTESDFPDSFGFGSSAAVTVAVAKALAAFFNIPLEPDDLFRLSFQAVLDVQGVGSGFDVAASVYGGTIYYAGRGKEIRQLKNGYLPMAVGYTKIKADTPTLIRQVAELRRTEGTLVEQVFKEISVLVERAAEELPERHFGTMGELMTRNQELLARLKVSSIELDTLIRAALSAGAYGAKLSGAGGGDCMVCLGPEGTLAAIEAELVRAGGEAIRVGVGAAGVRLEV